MLLSVPVKTPLLVQKLLPGLHFSMKGEEKLIYLTFDDGPLPDFCPWILQCLKDHKAKATFFLVGENAAANPKITRQIIDEGHSIGNHTQNHLNGFKTRVQDYVSNVNQCHQVLKPFLSETERLLFRPPYGKIRPAQARALRKAGFEIIMWDVLSKDYDPSLSAESIYNNVMSHAGPGSIPVFHDHIKSAKNLRIALPRILESLSNQGYRFEAIRLPLKG